MLKIEKHTLRKEILTLLRNQKEEERLIKSLAIADKLFRMQAFERSNTILFYVSYKGEVHTTEMIKKAQQLGKKVGLPKVLEQEKCIIPKLVKDCAQDLEEGPYGIQQPKEAAETLNLQDIDMVIVPGVAFDKHKNRLGRGGGYYDRFLKNIPTGVFTVGLAFDFQIVDELPALEEHDVAMSYVVSN